MKNTLITLCFSILATFLFGCEFKSTAEDKITFGVAAMYPPFEYKSGNELMGFDIDLAKAIAKELNKKVEFDEMQFLALFPSLQNGTIDAAISTITVTEERKKNFDFSNPYYFEDISVVYRKDHPVTSKDDMKNAKIACTIGTSNERWLKKNAPSAQIMTFDNTNLSIEALKVGHIDAIIMDGPTANTYISNNQQLAYKILEKDANGLALAVKKGSPLLADINRALAALAENGELAKMQKQWLGDYQQ